MGLAVCGTHYSGMYAATYTLLDDVPPMPAILLNGQQAAMFASHGSMLLCYVLTYVWVTKKLDHEAIYQASIKPTNKRSVAPSTTDSEA